MSLCVGLFMTACIPSSTPVPPCYGEKSICYGIIEPVIEINVVSEREVYERCGRNAKALACADIMAGLEKCVIYITVGSGRVTLMHEINHCRGWDHREEDQGSYSKPWKPFPVIIRELINRQEAQAQE